MSTHTKGPWHAKGITIYGTTHTHISADGTSTTWRSSFSIGNGWGSIEQRQIDARLMAAAPELLEALKGILAITDRNHVVWASARAAIAKAEGK